MAWGPFGTLTNRKCNWPGRKITSLSTIIFLNPIGVAEKTGELTSIRVINDYSFPDGASVNDFSNRVDFPEISYNPPKDIARQILELRIRFPCHPILIMLGDVSGAFCHIPVSAQHVHMFAFRFEGLLIIDLSCGFGWCGSPAYYSLAGSLINYLYQQQRPQPALAPLDSSSFVGNVWCDDHTCVELDTGTRCFEANLALRKAMAVVLGPNAINEEKFTTWSTSTKALGLIWNTASGTVSVPTEKLSKSLHQIALALNSTNCTLSTINKLIGRLRYVSTCFPAARPFYQNLQVFAGTFTRQHIRRTIPQDVREDLLWFQAVLELQHRFNSIPVEYFGDLLPPSRHVLMDASDSGLCVLETQLKQYIRMKFDATVRKSFAISNKCARINERSSGRTTLGPSMDGYRERPDSCSSSAWTQVTVHPPYNDLLNFWETISETMLSPTQRLENITLSGYNGVNSANGSAGLAGSPSPDDQQTRNSAASRHTDGSRG
ncbi:hypothetical protein F441_06301 [Phytophthora nicotianae CJ01A1]|uniref:Reverse transcriptase domain-containing protein n=2 Tax=Phytophthora nicotianae TaxID=4792 RepID=W2XBT5_PHYNI|nr:hypothetical protein F441_06301 [Phytophthora nicotianae CJ01A1]